MLEDQTHSDSNGRCISAEVWREMGEGGEQQVKNLRNEIIRIKTGTPDYFYNS